MYLSKYLLLSSRRLSVNFESLVLEYLIFLNFFFGLDPLIEFDSTFVLVLVFSLPIEWKNGYFCL